MSSHLEVLEGRQTTTNSLSYSTSGTREPMPNKVGIESIQETDDSSYAAESRELRAVSIHRFSADSRPASSKIRELSETSGFLQPNICFPY